jgi:hypothetical protein
VLPDGATTHLDNNGRADAIGLDSARDDEVGEQLIEGARVGEGRTAQVAKLRPR